MAALAGVVEEFVLHVTKEVFSEGYEGGTPGGGGFAERACAVVGMRRDDYGLVHGWSDDCCVLGWRALR